MTEGDTELARQGWVTIRAEAGSKEQVVRAAEIIHSLEGK